MGEILTIYVNKMVEYIFIDVKFTADTLFFYNNINCYLAIEQINDKGLELMFHLFMA